MRMLVFTDDPAAEANLGAQLDEIAEGDELDLKVVAPPRPESTLDLATADVDDAPIGDADQLLAIADALAEFEAEQIVLVDPVDDELAGAARKRFGLPVTELSAG